MASKMKKTKKQRTPKFVDHEAKKQARRLTQGLQEDRNKELSRTPWQKAKDKRFHSPARVAKRRAWEKKSAKKIA